ncbi:MAG TPA: TrmH family RNA methyltransferase [Acidimicrobiales bacterium]|jgi:tRNA G18 (ribose-2'-O)-methylase SpoU|nr:TrmH family RNA methyltransferase [Acidimicrobiales bacterium]
MTGPGDPHGLGGGGAGGKGPPDPLDDYRALNDPQRRRQVERRGGYFVVEGLLALEALLGSRYPVRSVLVTERRADRVRALVGDRAPLLVRPQDEVADVAGFNVHRGVLAAADRLPPAGVAEAVGTSDLVVVTEGLGDHENLGALFRNAAALGAGAVLLDPTTADPLYRRSVRVSLGHVLRVPWARLAPLPGGLAEVTAIGLETAALTPAPGAVTIDDYAADVASRRRAAAAADRPAAATDRPAAAGEAGPAAGAGRRVRVALVVGAEGPGLTPATLAAADRRVRIALAPGVDSLNVATATAIALHRLS